MSSGRLKLQIITPEAMVFSGECDMLTVPTQDGEIGILPGHIALITQVLPGELVICCAGEPHHYAVGDGFLTVNNDAITFLTEMALKDDVIDEAVAEEARRRAEARLQEVVTDEEIAAVNATLAHSLAQLKVKHRHKGGGGCP